MFPNRNLPPVEERNESFMHKIAKEKLAEWLHTEGNYVVEEYPIIECHCGTWDALWVEVSGVGEKVNGGWNTGKTYKELFDNPITDRRWMCDEEGSANKNKKPLYPIAICDVFTYSSGKIPVAMEIWEVRHTNAVTPEKRKAVLDCYSVEDEGYGNPYPDSSRRVSPHFFEVDASVILSFDAKIKPKDALRKLRSSLKDLNPKAQLTEKQWRAQFEKEDEIEYKDELEKRFKESEDYKEHLLDIETRRNAKKEELDQAVKTINMTALLAKLFEPHMIQRYHKVYENLTNSMGEEESKSPSGARDIRSFFGKPGSWPVRMDARPVEWAESILKTHLKSMLPSSLTEFKAVKKAWMKKNDTKRLIINDSD